MNIEVLTGPQGGGKSRTMREEAAANPGLYLFAAPTIALIRELAVDLRKAMPGWDIRDVHSESGGKGTVSDRLKYAREQIAAGGNPKAVIITTHETMMRSDMGPFTDWHFRIDEAPNAVQAGSIDVRLLRSWFKENFALDAPKASEWSALTFTGAPANWKAVENSPAKGLKEFVKQAQQPGRVFVKATDWEGADTVLWFSMWTPLSLGSPASVQVAGSAYTESVAFKAIQAIYEHTFNFTIREINEPRTAQPDITISYFTDSHTGSTAFWEKTEGRLMIRKVCDRLFKVLPASAFWSGNTVVQHLMEHRIEANLIDPMVAGLNKHRKAKACAFIFSAKSQPADAGLKAAFGFTDEDIRKAREDDAITQFVMRGAIREPACGGPYAIYLYEKQQAERLSNTLTKNGFQTVKLVGIDAGGTMAFSRPKAPSSSLTDDAKKTKRRADKAASMSRSRDKKAAAEGKPLPKKRNRPQE